ncbi:MAG: SDR family NAD(P)-dependent oxidoreductase [Pseudomonadota bacterium]
MSEPGERPTAIVTGGARGIGRGCALKLAEAGCAVALVDVLVPEMARTKGEIEALGVPCLTFEADVADHGAAKEVAEAVLADWGRIDILVNNAGRSMPKGILEVSEAEWDATINVNLKSCFNYVQAVAPAMLAAERGRIVSMSSLNAHSGGVTAAVSRFAYAAAKAGILGMTRALAKELGPHVQVNAVCPGLIKTEITKNAVIAERESELIEGIALHRVGAPRDVAELVGFLALSEPCFITGQAITIDGFQWNM